ncbi:hypothetical protein G6F43_004940 [Rhizopus delemar]|nr:hypothetical protein G6F43_004940 [Rhizopus delemar]
MYQYENIKVEVSSEGIAHVQINRPNSLNALLPQMIIDIGKIFQQISDDNNVRCVILSSSGRMFTAGLDLAGNELSKLSNPKLDTARNTYRARPMIKLVQDAFTAVELCSKPVIAAIHNACIGGGVDLTTACDIRYCTKDAYFSVKEVDLGFAADVGSLQRLPKVIGNHSLIRELCYTARNMYADEALQCGLVNKVTENHASLLAEAFKTAQSIASKSPIAILSTKHLLNYSRDHSVAEGLDYSVTWNSAMLQTEDVSRSIEGLLKKTPVKYSKI